MKPIEVSSGCSCCCHRLPSPSSSQSFWECKYQVVCANLGINWHSCHQANVPVDFNPFNFLMKLYNHSPWFQVQGFMTLFVLMQPILHWILNYQEEVPLEFTIYGIFFLFQEEANGFPIILLPLPHFWFTLCHKNMSPSPLYRKHQMPPDFSKSNCCCLCFISNSFIISKKLLQFIVL